jgi:PAS domain S-box-containing protein
MTELEMVVPYVMDDESVPATSEERFKLLVNSVRDYAIFMLDPDGNVVSWNSGAQVITGYKPNEIIGKHFSVFYTKTATETGWPAEELRHASIHGRTEDEGWRIRKDGSMYWANVIITALHDEKGHLRGFAKVTRDMSERQRLEQLESSSQRMNEFLATLAHELRNPLAPIRNAVSIMQMEANLSPTMKSCRDVIDRQLTQMTRLVDDLLDVGRITTGKITLHKENIDVREILQRSIEGVKPQFDFKNQVLDVTLPDEDEIVINGDLMRLVQVLQNLLNNASKFTPNKGRITVSTEAENNCAAIRITDTGRGITKEALGQVFNLFVQEDAALNPTESGLGIGLTLASSLVELHGGAIEALSDGPGLGSTFIVRLPRVVESGKRDGDDLANGEPSVKCCDVMVVDDNRDSADSMAMLLSIMGHQTRAVYDGQTAIELAASFTPHIVLLDLAMPGLDGFQVLSKLRSMPALCNTTIIAMTGFGGEDAYKKSLDAGFDYHITKPVNQNVLAQIITTVELKLQNSS